MLSIDCRDRAERVESPRSALQTTRPTPSSRSTANQSANPTDKHSVVQPLLVSAKPQLIVNSSSNGLRNGVPNGLADVVKYAPVRHNITSYYQSPDEKTPLINRDNKRIYSSNSHVPHIGKASDLETNSSNTGSEMDEEVWFNSFSKLKFVKILLLSSLIIFTLLSFIFINESENTWSNIAVEKKSPAYIDLSDSLDTMFPVWRLKARSSFVPIEYENLTDSDVFFSIVRVKDDDERELLKGPWSTPIAPNKLLITHNHEVEHTFVFTNKDDYDEDQRYQLKVETNLDEAVSISINVSGFSELSLDGILLAGGVLVLLYIMIIFEIVQRTLAAMIGATAAITCLTLIRDRPSLEKIISWLDVETLALLFGMMVLVAILCETGFFDYVSVLAFKLAKGQIWPLIFTLCIFTGVLSAFLDNVTTILLMTPVTIRLCEIKNIDPKHVLIALVIFSNIGGAATPVGDPPNVIIISNAKIQQQNIDFARFTYHMLPGVIFSFIGAMILLRILYRDISRLKFDEPPELVGNKRLMEYLKDEVENLNGIEREQRRIEERCDRSAHSRPLSSHHISVEPNFNENSNDFSVRSSNELKREIDVWKKACRSISGYSRDENSVRSVLKRKVMALESLLRKHLYDSRPSDDDFLANLKELETKYRIRNKPLLIKSAVVMALVIVLFFLQSIPNLDLSLGWIAILGAILLLILSDFDELDSIFARVEWSTLIFFAALFVVMEALAELKFLWWIGQLTQNLINSVHEDNRLIVAILVFLWVSALASSLIDNIPFTTVMVKIIEDLAENNEFNVPLTPLIYALAFGACLGGNGTLIGASANVVCAGVAEQHGYKFTFIDFFKIGFPVMFLTICISTIYLIVCHVVLQWN